MILLILRGSLSSSVSFNMSIQFIALTLIVAMAAVHAAPSIPADCADRLNAMDENLKIALIVTNVNQKLYQREQELNQDYCL